MNFAKYLFSWWNTKSRKEKVLTNVVFFLIIVALVICFSPKIVEGSSAYRVALPLITNSPIIKINFGEEFDLEVSYFDGFTLNDRGIDGEAEFVVLVSGNGNEGKAFFKMYKENRRWHIDRADLTIQGVENVTLKVPPTSGFL